MKPRALAILAAAAVAGAVGGWFWFGSGGDDEPPLAVSSDATAPRGDSPPPSAGAGAPSTAPGAAPGAPAGDEAPAPPRIISSVVPGMPMTRGATPAPPAAGAAPVVARPVKQREGMEDLENVQDMFRNFRTRMGENPVGTNAEIMKAVMGGNPVQARLGPPEGQSLNEQGELVDRWGTAYFFHQLSKDQMEIRSAGPDHILWTTDDVVAK